MRNISRKNPDFRGESGIFALNWWLQCSGRSIRASPPLFSPLSAVRSADVGRRAARLPEVLHTQSAVPRSTFNITSQNFYQIPKTDMDIITILGPTACGKTGFAVALARSIDAEIISADSRQVYRRMDLGTGKDMEEYGEIPVHLVDIAEPGTKYNLFRYQHDFLEAYRAIRARGRRVILCGGTGLYLESVVRGYQISEVPRNDTLRAELEGRSLEELTAMLARLKAQSGTTMHNTTDVDTAKRAIRAIEIETYNLQQDPLGRRDFPAFSSLNIGLDIPRDLRRERITARLKARLDAGMLDEIRALLAEGIPAEDLIYYGLEYKYLTLHVIGQLTFDEMFTQLETAIHQFAKRQMTWFRGMERRGTPITWIDATKPMEEKVADALDAIARAEGGNAEA